MPRLKQFLNRRLTGRETAAAIAVVALAAGLAYWAYQFASAKVLEWRVQAATPKICAEIREECGKLVRAIEDYKTQFGFYPPDHVLGRQPLVVDPVTNTLFYELAGTVYDPNVRMFEAGGMEAAEEKYVKVFFQIDGFKNCAENPGKVTRFLKMEPLPVRQLHDDPDVFAVGFQLPYGEFAPEVILEFQASTWRYVSSSPTNNPGKFDLWMELKTRHWTVVIGNWASG